MIQITVSGAYIYTCTQNPVYPFIGFTIVVLYDCSINVRLVFNTYFIFSYTCSSTVSETSDQVAKKILLWCIKYIIITHNVVLTV